MVTTVLKLSEISNPIIFAVAQHEKSTIQYSNHIPLMPKMEFPTATNVAA